MPLRCKQGAAWGRQMDSFGSPAERKVAWGQSQKNASKTSCTAGRRLRKRKCYKARCPAALQQPRARAGQVTAGAIDTRADRLIPPAPLLRRRVSREAFFGVRVVGRSVVYPGNRLVVVVSDIQRFTLSQHPKYKAAAGF